MVYVSKIQKFMTFKEVIHELEQAEKGTEEINALVWIDENLINER